MFQPEEQNPQYNSIPTQAPDAQQPVQQAPVTQAHMQPEPTAPVSAQPPLPPVPPTQEGPAFSAHEPPQMPEKPKKKKKSGAGKLVAVALVCALIGGAGGAAGVGGILYHNLKQESGTQTLQNEQPSAPQSPSETETPHEEPENVEFVSTTISVDRNDGATQLTPAEIYEKYVNAVVIITQEGTTTNIFGQVSPTAGSGSGFILTQDGYILTNYHVVEGATTLTVTAYDKKEYDATVVGYDADNDVALIKIDAQGLPVVAVGDSDALAVGDQVVAIGNPLGELTNTLTVGYISSTQREVSESSDSAPINMLQTDAAINGGNSGGPLFDLSGNVIGITTAKYTGSQIEGLGFAIPINDAMAIVDDLLQYGYVKDKPYMGFLPQNMSSSAAETYNLPMGVYVYSVEEGTPAEKAGLVRGDIITQLGDYEITSYNDLVAALRHFKAGDTTTMKVFHSGAYQDLRITFTEKPRQEETTQQQEQQEQVNPYSGFSGFGW